MKNILLFGLLLAPLWLGCHEQQVCFVIHGTWAYTESWYQPGGNFFDELCNQGIKKGITTIPFTWSGNLDNASRKQAGINLAHLIQSYPEGAPCTVVAHSHGCNVGIIASQELAIHATGHRIQKFYALAPPVDVTGYLPNMDIIDYFFNFFSCNDFIQPIFGIFGRVYPEHPRIANIRVLIDGKEPDHSDLHDTVIARSLFQLTDYLPKKRSTQEFDCTPMLLRFFSNDKPHCEYDEQRAMILARDRWLTNKLMGPFHRTKNRNRGYFSSLVPISASTFSSGTGSAS